MVRLLPVEASAMDEQDFLVAQKIEGKLFVVGDMELFDVELREHVKGCFRFYDAQSGNVL